MGCIANSLCTLNSASPKGLLERADWQLVPVHKFANPQSKPEPGGWLGCWLQVHRFIGPPTVPALPHYAMPAGRINPDVTHARFQSVLGPVCPPIHDLLLCS